jgi:hypothetical protein
MFGSSTGIGMTFSCIHRPSPALFKQTLELKRQVSR